jgi:hypothetical protein
VVHRFGVVPPTAFSAVGVFSQNQVVTGEGTTEFEPTTLGQRHFTRRHEAGR